MHLRYLIALLCFISALAMMANVPALEGTIITLTGQTAGDRLGQTVAAAGDINGDGIDDYMIGAPFASPNGEHSGQVYVIYGGYSPSSTVDLSALASGTGGFVVNGENNDDYAGYAIAGGDDINGDGLDDMVIGAPYAEGPNGAYSGKTYVLYGGTGYTTVELSAIASTADDRGFVLYGAYERDYSGGSLALRDIDGDGLADIVVGETILTPADHAGRVGGSGSGSMSNIYADASAAYVVHGQDRTAPLELSSLAAAQQGFVIQSPDRTLAANPDNNDFSFWRQGAVVSSGDVNGDGLADINIGSGDGGGFSLLTAGIPPHEASLITLGKADHEGVDYTLQGIDNGYRLYASELDTSVVEAEGTFVYDGHVGSAPSIIGDVNGDGLRDLAVSVSDPYGYLDWGQSLVFIVFGQADPVDVSLDDVANGAGGGFVIDGAGVSDDLLLAVKDVGDLNGDGLDDIAIGNPETSQLHIVHGSRTVADVTIGASAASVSYTDSTAGQLGWSVNNAGDLNGDGLDDLIVGAPAANSHTGAAYVLLANASGFTQGDQTANALLGDSAADTIVAGGGDDSVAGNGGLDVLYSGPGNDSIAIADTGFARIDGGPGTDRLSFQGSGLVLDLAAAPDRVRGIEIFDINGSGANQISLHKTATGNGKVIVLGGSDDTLISKHQQWRFDGDISDGGITYQVFDDGQGAVLWVQAGISVDINDPPVIQSDQAFSVVENSPAGTLLGDVLAADSDAGDNITAYTITAGDPQGLFAISESGRLTVARQGIDYETVAAYSLTVEATDSYGEIDNATVSVSVTDIDNTAGLQQTFAINLPEQSVWGDSQPPDLVDNLATLTDIVDNSVPSSVISLPYTHTIETVTNSVEPGLLDYSLGGDVTFDMDASLNGGLVSADLPVKMSVSFPDEIPADYPVRFSSSALFDSTATLNVQSPAFSIIGKVALSDFHYSVSSPILFDLGTEDTLNEYDSVDMSTESQSATGRPGTAGDLRIQATIDLTDWFSAGRVPYGYLQYITSHEWQGCEDDIFAVPGAYTDLDYLYKVNIFEPGLEATADLLQNLEARVMPNARLTLEDGQTTYDFVMGEDFNLTVPAAADVNGDGIVTAQLDIEVASRIRNSTTITYSMNNHVEAGLFHLVLDDTFCDSNNSAESVFTSADVLRGPIIDLVQSLNSENVLDPIDVDQQQIAFSHTLAFDLCASSETEQCGATQTNAPVAYDAAFTPSLTLDGADDYVSTSLAIDLENEDFTLEAWIKTDVSGVNQYIALLNDSDDTLESGEKAFYVDADGKLVFQGPGEGAITGASAVNDGQWRHVAVVWNAFTHAGNVYVDGVEDTLSDTYAPDGAVDTGLTLKFGAALNGEIDEVRVWNTPRNRYNIHDYAGQALTPPLNGLLLYYGFADGQTAVADLSGNNNAGQLYRENHAPVAADFTATVTEDTSGNTLNPLSAVIEVDPDQPLILTALGTPDHGGIAVISSDGTQVAYTPAGNFFGTETFSYTVDDGHGGSDSGLVSVTVNNIDDAPAGGVTIDGEAVTGERLSANTGTLADNDGLGTLSYQWQSNDADISGANAVDYTVTSSDAGKTLRVVVSYIDAGGTLESVTSAAAGTAMLRPEDYFVLQAVGSVKCAYAQQGPTHVPSLSCKPSVSAYNWYLDDSGLIHNKEYQDLCMDGNATLGGYIGYTSCSLAGAWQWQGAALSKLTDPSLCMTEVGDHYEVLGCDGRDLQRFRDYETLAQPSSAPGFGYSLVLDGVDDYVELSDEPNFDFSGAFSVEAWIKVDSFTRTWQTIVAKGNNSWRLSRLGDGNTLHFAANLSGGGGVYVDGASNVNDGRWHHIAGVADTANDMAYLYVDGELDGQAAIPADAAFQVNDYPVTIGENTQLLNRYFHGQIDEVRIWNTARGQAQIRQHKGLGLSGTENGLMAYYSFDENGREVLDHGTQGHHGTLQPGGPAATRVDNQVADFDGVDDYIQLDADTWFDGDFTIETWVYPRAYNNWSRVLDFGNGPDADNVVLVLSRGTSGMPGFGVRIGADDTAINPNQSLPLNTWSHLAVVLSGNSGVMYIDGQEVARNDNMNIPASVIRKNAYIGRSNWGSDAYANARFDELRIWNTARSQAQIQQAMYQGLNGRETGLLAYYDFEDRVSGALTDRSGNGHDVSPHRAFSGNGSYLDTGRSVLDMNNDFTIEAWIKTSASQAQGIVVKNNDDGTWNPGEKALYLTTEGRVEYVGYGNDYIRGNTPVNDGRWHHIAVAFRLDTSTNPIILSRRIYVDGVDDSRVSDYFPRNSDNGGDTVKIGAPNYGEATHFFNGEIDRLRFWNEARHQVQIQASMNALVVDDDNALVRVGYVGATLRSEAARDYRQALDFDGVDDYVDAGTATWFSGDLTIESWVYPRSYNSWSRVIDFGNGPNLDNVLLALTNGTSGKPRFGIQQSGMSTVVDSPVVLPLNTWSHVAATLSGTQGILYINGHRVAHNNNMNIPNAVTRNNAYIGRSNWDQDAYPNALMDELRIWNVARSQAEIQGTLNAALSGKESGLLAYYPLDGGSGTVLRDLTGNGHDGSLVNGPARTGIPGGLSGNGELSGQLPALGDTLYTLVSNSDLGNVSLNGDGSFSYSPANVSTVGDDSFGYRVTNSSGIQTVAVTLVGLDAGGGSGGSSTGGMDLLSRLATQQTTAPGPCQAWTYPALGVSELAAINTLPQLGGLVLAQNPQHGGLEVTFGDTRFALVPDSLRLNHGGDGLALDAASQEASFYAAGNSLNARPVTQAPCALQQAVGSFTLAAGGVLRIPAEGGLVVARPAWNAHRTSAEGSVLSLESASRILFRFSDPAGTWQQAFHPVLLDAPPNVRLEAEGEGVYAVYLPDGEVYRFIPDFLAIGPAPGDGAWRVEDIGDLNGDGLQDYRLSYPDGYRQQVYSVR